MPIDLVTQGSARVEDLPDLGLLATWVAVLEASSVSAAAKRLSISQAAVSQRLKLLESALGIELLDRTTRPARPTAAGRWLCPRYGPSRFRRCRAR